MPQQIERLRLATPELAPITLINRDLGTEALERLYAEADAMVLPSRGEGFNIPAAEAMAAGLSLIVTGAGAHMDFVDADFARLLDYRFAPSGTHLRTADSVWFEPDVDDLVAALQECLATHRSQDEKAVARLRRGHTAAAAVADGLAWAGRIRASALDLLLAPEPQSPLIAWVTTWNVRCGIAEYSRMLLGGWPNSGRAVTVLRDERLPESDVAGVDQPSSRSAWRRDAETGLDACPSEIAATNAQVVVIQHQPGLISWPHLARLLRDSRLSGRCVVVMLHNVQSMRRPAMRPTSRSWRPWAASPASLYIRPTTEPLEGAWADRQRCAVPARRAPAGPPGADAAGPAARVGAADRQAMGSCCRTRDSRC